MIRNQIETVVGLMTSVPPVAPETEGTAPNFFYGTRNELNLLADNAQFPCVFMYTLQPATLEFQLNNSINDTYSLYLEFLFLTEFGEFTSQNEVYINQALAMAKEFMIRLKDYRADGVRRFFKVKSGDKAKSMPVYNKFNANTTGVNLTITLNTLYNDQLCF